MELLNEIGKMQFGKFNGRQLIGVIVVLILVISMISLFSSGTGAFLVLGLLIATITAISNHRKNKQEKSNENSVKEVSENA